MERSTVVTSHAKKREGTHPADGQQGNECAGRGQRGKKKRGGTSLVPFHVERSGGRKGGNQTEKFGTAEAGAKRGPADRRRIF